LPAPSATLAGRAAKTAPNTSQTAQGFDGWERFQTVRANRRNAAAHIKTDPILLCTRSGGDSVIHDGPGRGSGAGESLMRSLRFDDRLAGSAVRTATACTLALALYAGPALAVPEAPPPQAPAAAPTEATTPANAAAPANAAV